MQLFFLSGLGADNSVFQFLDLKDYKNTFIEWIPPEKNESLQHYALRLKDKFIPDNAVVVGLSFGGMLATEIAREYPEVKAIIISSSKTKYELPPYYRTGKLMPLHHWLPDAAQRWFMLRMKWLFGISTATSVKIYEDLIKNCNTNFNRWALNAILNWNNTQIPRNVIHIHGTHDKVLPFKYVQCDYTIQRGEHLMIMEQADIISKLLKELIMMSNINQQALSSLTNQFAGHSPV